MLDPDTDEASTRGGSRRGDDRRKSNSEAAGDLSTQPGETGKWVPPPRDNDPHAGIATPSERRRANRSRHTNFTMDVTFVLNRRDPQGLDYVPARAKMDTACDHNLISIDMIRRMGLEDKIEILERPVELNGLGGSQHALDKKVTLTWYLKRGMRSRVSDYYVVEDEAFDVVLGSVFWGGAGSGSAYILHGLGKTRGR